MKNIRYDFSELTNIMYSIKDNPNTNNMNKLQKELNRFFKDSTCKGVIYTKNTDKVFFGMCVMPVIDGNKAVDILHNNEVCRINEYYLELDSKLFDPLLALSSRELVAILLHEVGHIVNNNAPVDEVRKEIDSYLAKEDDNLVIADSIHYKEILAFGIKDFIRRTSSLFEIEDAVETVREAANSDVNIIFGAIKNENLQDEVIVTVIATGFKEEVDQKEEDTDDTTAEA